MRPPAQAQIAAATPIWGMIDLGEYLAYTDV
jgi:hypothetical protein